MRQKMKFGGGIFPPPQGNFPVGSPGFGLGGGGGPQGIILPSFEVPFADLGAGVVSLAEIRTSATPTFTRATTAWTRLASGLWAEVASGVPRSYYNASGEYCGILMESLLANRCLWSRDLTNAVWISGGGGVTAAKDAVGIDGVSNSCSTLTAAGANGTLLQSIVSASIGRIFWVYVKRKTGTGNVFITLDGDTTRTDITSSINSSTFTAVSMVQTLANPVVGFKLETAGDEIIVDMCHEETTTVITSPIPTTAAAVTKNADTLSYTTAWFNSVEGSFACTFTPFLAAFPGERGLVSMHDGTTNERIQMGIGSGSLGPQLLVVDGGVTQASVGPANAFTQGSPGKLAWCYKANDLLVVLNNGAPVTDTSVTLPTVTTLSVGARNGTAALCWGAIRSLRYYNRRLSNSQLQALTA